MNENNIILGGLVLTPGLDLVDLVGIAWGGLSIRGWHSPMFLKVSTINPHGGFDGFRNPPAFLGLHGETVGLLQILTWGCQASETTRW